MKANLLASAIAAMALSAAGPAGAHCDTLDGPVIGSARQALDAGKVTPVLGWVRAADEAEIRAAFAKALEVRKASPGARELADRYFFETLVRVHRAGEGADYTGLKPAGTIEPPIAAADAALASGKLDKVDALLSGRIHAGLERKFHEAVELRRAASKAPEDVALNRRAASAYVEYVHYVERLHEAAGSKPHGEAEAPAVHKH